VLFDYGGVLRRDERASAYDVIDTKFNLAPRRAVVGVSRHR
jgi:hypothetical protein